MGVHVVIHKLGELQPAHSVVTMTYSLFHCLVIRQATEAPRGVRGQKPSNVPCTEIVFFFFFFVFWGGGGGSLSRGLYSGVRG